VNKTLSAINEEVCEDDISGVFSPEAPKRRTPDIVNKIEGQDADFNEFL
jgi:hypothetical protein